VFVFVCVYVCVSVVSDKVETTIIMIILIIIIIITLHPWSCVSSVYRFWSNVLPEWMIFYRMRKVIKKIRAILKDLIKQKMEKLAKLPDKEIAVQLFVLTL